MTAQPGPTPVLARLAAAALAALALTLAVAAPAAAHDELTGSDPAADSTVAEAPTELTLTFSGALMDEPGATELVVTDAAGTAIAAGDPVVDGTSVRQQLSAAEPGAVTVVWKTVSSDGHPISGEYSFTVGADAASPSAQPSESAQASAEETTAEETAAVPATAEPDEQPGPMPWWVPLIIVAVAVSGALLYLAVSRVRRHSEH
ncbi:copper resistance CopC family protein [Microbacterium sp.]|uniref:copper resistance CopC family protein n=1 Tax=Microbacterium sp. TaxID=51671 RepID=UPI0039E4B2AA